MFPLSHSLHTFLRDLPILSPKILISFNISQHLNVLIFSQYLFYTFHLYVSWILFWIIFQDLSSSSIILSLAMSNMLFNPSIELSILIPLISGNSTFPNLPVFFLYSSSFIIPLFLFTILIISNTTFKTVTLTLFYDPKNLEGLTLQCIEFG